MGPVGKLISTTIGVTSEYKAHRNATAEDSAPDLVDDSDVSEEHDEETWELDEAQPPPPYDESALQGDDGVDTPKVLAAFFQKYPQQPPSKIVPLPCPVILPQRRPQIHGRGFVRAYAPDLQGCGITQEMWLDFLQGFAKAIKMSPVFHAVNGAVALAALGISIAAGPSPTIHFSALAVHTSIEAGRRGYTHHETNKYLDEMNDRFFKPRNLYALIMSYKSSTDSADLEVDLQTNITKAVSTRSGPGGRRSAFKMTSGKSHGEAELAPAAPLIFPGLDELPENQKKGVSLKPFLADYYDRRAQARFAAENPDSSLDVAPHKEWASRYADPNHPANSGDVVSLISGGKLPGRKERRMKRRGLLAEKGIKLPGGMTEEEVKEKKQKGVKGMVKKVVKEDVLYLMVVNLPTEEEMRSVLEGLGVHGQ